MRRSSVVLALVLSLTVQSIVALPTLAGPGEVGAISSTPYDEDQAKLQAMVDELRDTLALEAPVLVAVVEEDRHAFSVTPTPEDAAWPFRLSVEAAFLALLTDEEARAAVAHELGHVWVYTHHPYLQTERLANRIALRVVSREYLERLYQKVWVREGVGGDLANYLDP